MKKLILTAAVALAAVVSQAATVEWGSAKLFTAASAEGGFSATVIGTSAKAYLFTLTAGEYDSFLADYKASGNMKSVWDAYKGSLNSATGTATTGSRTSAASIKTTADVDATVYGAIIYTYSDATLEKDFYIANIATGTVGGEASIILGNLGTYYLGKTTDGVATGGWSPVPEPTSGLLMLVGLAGLALKRKRA